MCRCVRASEREWHLSQGAEEAHVRSLLGLLRILSLNSLFLAYTAGLALLLPIRSPESTAWTFLERCSAKTVNIRTRSRAGRSSFVLVGRSPGHHTLHIGRLVPGVSDFSLIRQLRFLQLPGRRGWAELFSLGAGTGGDMRCGSKALASCPPSWQEGAFSSLFPSLPLPPLSFRRTVLMNLGL